MRKATASLSCLLAALVLLTSRARNASSSAMAEVSILDSAPVGMGTFIAFYPRDLLAAPHLRDLLNAKRSASAQDLSATNQEKMGFDPGSTTGVLVAVPAATVLEQRAATPESKGKRMRGLVFVRRFRLGSGVGYSAVCLAFNTDEVHV